MIGLDMIRASRIKGAIDRWGDRFLKRVFTQREIGYCLSQAHPERHLACRFAAKEALLKALGMGIFRGAKLKEIEVINAPSGRPLLQLHGRVREICEARGVKDIYLSLTHEGDYGMAICLLEGKG